MILSLNALFTQAKTLLKYDCLLFCDRGFVASVVTMFFLLFLHRAVVFRYSRNASIHSGVMSRNVMRSSCLLARNLSMC